MNLYTLHITEQFLKVHACKCPGFLCHMDFLELRMNLKMKKNRLFSFGSYQHKIEEITQILFEKFDRDVLLYFYIHGLPGYECKKLKNFIFITSLPSCLKNLNKSNCIELRFFCKTDKDTMTSKQNEFFASLKNKSSKAQFFLSPYYAIGSEENLKDLDEKFYTCQFKYEFNLKIEEHSTTFKLVTKTKSPVIKKIYLQLQAILNNSSKTENKRVQIKKFFAQNEIRLPEGEIKQSIHNLMGHMNKGDCYLANMTYTQTLPDSQFLSCHDFIKKWFHLKSRYGIYFEKPAIGLACFSPERFLLCKNNFLVSEPIKGTFACPESKPKLIDAQNLWKNKKEIYEHTLVVDLMRNDLNTYCFPGTVHVYKPFQACVAGKLLQMQTTIIGKKEKAVSLGECLSAMLPAGSITGTPKKKVCQLISRYEKNKRGYYTGVCGILESNGNFDSCVLIRSIYKGTRGTYVGVGAGITTLSDTNAEIDEFKLKLQSFLNNI